MATAEWGTAPQTEGQQGSWDVVGRRHNASVHLVKPGESIEQIGSLYGVDPEYLMSRNGIRPGMVVEPGRRLRLT